MLAVRFLKQARELAKDKDKDKDKSGKPSGGAKLTARADRDPRISEKEWKKIMSFTYTGARRCPWFNCSLGCRFGDQCRNKHICVQCGGDRPYHGNH